MPTDARVTSLDALERFRANLIVFLSRSRHALDAATDEARRTRLWLQTDQRLYWEGEIRRWQRTLDQAEQELLSARISSLRDTTTAQQAAVHHAKRALAEAGEKLRMVRRWTRDFDVVVDPLVKQMNALRNVLDQDLPSAVTFLAQAQRHLDEYAETAPPPQTPALNTEEAA